MCAELVELPVIRQVFTIMRCIFFCSYSYTKFLVWAEIFYAGCQPQAELLEKYQPNDFAKPFM